MQWVQTDSKLLKTFTPAILEDNVLSRVRARKQFLKVYVLHPHYPFGYRRVQI